MPLPLTAWKHSRKKMFSETSEGFVIPVRNNSLNDWPSFLLFAGAFLKDLSSNDLPFFSG